MKHEWITKVGGCQDVSLPTFADEESIDEVRIRTECEGQVDEFAWK